MQSANTEEETQTMSGSQVQQLIDGLRDIPEAVTVEDVSPDGIDGVRVRFQESVSDFDEALSLVQSHTDDCPIVRFSNMTGENDDHIVILVEL